MRSSRKKEIFFILLALFLFIPSFFSGGSESYRLDLSSRPITYFASASIKNYRRANRGPEDIDYIVIHTVQGSLGSAINTFSSDRLGYPRSAHFTVGRDGTVVKSVSPDDIAWHAGTSPPGSGGDYESYILNLNSIGVEHGGFVSERPTREQYINSAALVSLLCEMYDVPKDRRHIVGHEEIKSAKGDPGPNWDWDYYMRLVKYGSRTEGKNISVDKPPAGDSFFRNILGLGFLAGGAVLSLLAYN